MRIAISGAGIAGTVLAYWLSKAGRHQPVLIEKAAALRTGGYVVDFWGLGFAVAERIGLRAHVLKEGYHQREVRFVNDKSERVGGFSTDVLHRLSGGRFTTIRRGALVEMAFAGLKGRVETIWGDKIATIHEHNRGARVTLEKGGERDFDIIVGADGLHSDIRSFCFGPESAFETYLGYGVAAFEIPGYPSRDEDIYVIHATASHQLARFALRDNRTLILFVFRCDAQAADTKLKTDAIRALLKSEFCNAGWEAPQILAAMEQTDDIYFDRMSQIRMPHWHQGRVVLIGDASAAVSLLAGEGTGLAMVEAYVLAGELAKAGDDYRRAFADYENKLRSFIDKKQAAAEKFSSHFIPKTEFGVWMRNQATKLMGIPGISSLLLGRMLRDDFDLPDYCA